MNIIIKSITNIDDYHKIEDLQRRIWGMTDLETIPARFMHALAHNGASLLGAYDGDKLVGFNFGVLGTAEGLRDRVDQVAAARLKMYSVIMGIHPDYQHAGIGYDLKLAQREFALRIGIRLITWTYDPLESRNGWLNIGKLGCVCDSYLRDFHGQMSGINAGLPTDRFEVSWWVTGNRAKSRTGDRVNKYGEKRRRHPLELDAILGGGAFLINEAIFNAAGFATPPTEILPATTRILLVEIPSNFQAIKKTDFPLAQQWRQHTRILFEMLFAQGYVVTDFARKQEPDQPLRTFYVLTHRNT
ncbi:MAG: hypothetical protein KC418_19165 [Anaerolineales bacterium]|nr:hypothetical protein [Anaerolineales bacterium]MCB8950781.1 hypothetical protein [Ardenticatenales bacterium]